MRVNGKERKSKAIKMNTAWFILMAFLGKRLDLEACGRGTGLSPVLRVDSLVNPVTVPVQSLCARLLPDGCPTS